MLLKILLLEHLSQSNYSIFQDCKCLIFPVLVSWHVHHWHFPSFLVSCFCFCVIFLSYIVIYPLLSMVKKKKKKDWSCQCCQSGRDPLSLCGDTTHRVSGTSVDHMPVLVSLFLLYAATSCSFGVKTPGWLDFKGKMASGEVSVSQVRVWSLIDGKSRFYYIRGPTEFFCKTPESEYFGLCGYWGLCHNYSDLLL